MRLIPQLGYAQEGKSDAKFVDMMCGDAFTAW